MKAISVIDGIKNTYSAGDLGRMDYGEFCEDYILIFGESAEIKPVYRSLFNKHNFNKHNFYSVFSNPAIFSEGRMYGIIIDRDKSGFSYNISVIGEGTLARFLYDLI